MPELPEVETTRRGVAPLLEGRRVVTVAVREPRLRQPVPAALPALLEGRRLRTVARRAKYLLFDFGDGTLLVHLGMSGSLRVVPRRAPLLPHDHVELDFGPRHCLRLRDPRRFGLMLWTMDDPLTHPLLAHLGPEPFDTAFDVDYLATLAHGRRGAVKNFIMDAHVVVGVGNIYASEALFRAGIHPVRAAGRVSRARYRSLIGHVREVLGEAIEAGGTTLRDFMRNDGEPGYFRHNLKVYGRAGEPCTGCGEAVRQRVIGQRSSFFCPRCQR
ncbi:MAG: bifunctional DNA-formamidopyrimidine glycosylase/DNA-(apurinic or apyrimidinic site) lyase [Gammaproteobacteria bacterium]|nr:bifunctional DNA-formamidopyrimidine glycosylase/DNA-(apurinic or apyrimidinic site) lyase [Gammaproteobacteria bacterium]MCP5200526.1 bifunctional DNA-formamidopyrimidine glycosylase/DNA-(apurinic or apyrimidinic site) lyase [Gammaproteobacteria bacterium]